MLSALEKIRGVKSVTATGERDSDAYAYIVESERGIDARKPIFNLCASKSWPILGMAPVGTDLETIFIRLVDRDNAGTSAPETRRSRAH